MRKQNLRLTLNEHNAINKYYLIIVENRGMTLNDQKMLNQ